MRLGCVTLVAALVATGAWVRSLVMIDQVFICTNTSSHEIALADGSLVWSCDDEPGFGQPWLNWVSDPLTEAHRYWVRQPIIARENAWVGYGFGTVSWTNTSFVRYADMETGKWHTEEVIHRVGVWMVPVWLFAIGLTLVTGLLFVGQFRSTKSESKV
jgi:hypothetical protein